MLRFSQRWFVLAACAAASVAASAQSVLTNAQQALDLGLEGARPGNVPVRLRGTLTYQTILSPRWAFVQDQTAGILVIMDAVPFPLAAGQIVDVEGVAEAGGRAPYIRAHSFRLAGAGPLPAPLSVTPAYLDAGNDFGQWAKISGTVRDVAITKHRLVCLCANGATYFQVWTTLHDPMPPLPLDLLDARLELQGVAWSGLESDRRSHGFLFDQPGTNWITVLQAGSRDIFHGPVVPIARLGAAQAWPDQRLRAAGVVTFFSEDGWLAAQDGTGSVVARLLQPILRDDDKNGQFLTRDWTPLKPGDEIDFTGAPTGAGAEAELLDAEYRVTGSKPVPAARGVSAADLQKGIVNGELITFKARLIDLDTRFKAHFIEAERGRGYDLFESRAWLRADGLTLDAILDAREARPLPLRRDDYVIVTGIYRSEPGPPDAPRSIHIFLRGPEDMAATAPPPWWSSRQAGAIAGGGLIFAAGAALWITLLRLRVAERTAALRAEVAEREKAETRLARFVSMVSHEIRNPLANILSSAETLERYLPRISPEERAEQLTVIREAVERMTILLEDVLLFNCAQAGQMTFRSEPFLLEPFCRRVVHEILTAARSRNPIEMKFSGLDAPAQGDKALIRHILSNLLNNAVKYSQPGQPVAVEVERAGEWVALRVRDRGMGIPAENLGQLFTPFFRGRNAQACRGTGLGLVIVRHCVDRHGGSIHIDSIEGAGCTVTVRLPVFRGETALAEREALA